MRKTISNLAAANFFANYFPLTSTRNEEVCTIFVHHFHGKIWYSCKNMVISGKYDSWSKKNVGQAIFICPYQRSRLKMLRLVLQIKIRSRTYSMVFWYNMRFQLWVIRTLLYTVCVRSVFTHCCCCVLCRHRAIVRPNFKKNASIKTQKSPNNAT